MRLSKIAFREVCVCVNVGFLHRHVFGPTVSSCAGRAGVSEETDSCSEPTGGPSRLRLSPRRLVS